MTLNFTPFYSYSAAQANGQFNLGADSLRLLLSNIAPVPTNRFLADITQIAAANGYPLNGLPLTIASSTQTSGVYQLVAFGTANLSAVGGNIGPFEYMVLYDFTSSNGPLVGWWDNGSPVTISVNQTAVFSFGPTNLVLQLQSS